jgi:hypothetical protein
MDLPIEAYEVGGAYFVSDGHHRVALARERETDFIDAEVTRLLTNYGLPPGVAVAQLGRPLPLGLPAAPRCA